MTQTVAARTAYVTILCGVPVLIVGGLAALHWYTAPPQSETAAPQSQLSMPAESGPTGVRFDRPHIVSAAGIEVATVGTQAAETVIHCTGSAGFNQNRYVKVPPKAAGIVRAIEADVGAIVRQGYPLAAVDAQAIGDLKAALIKAQVHEEHARWQIDRYQAAGDAVSVKMLVEAQHLLEEELTDKRRIVDRLSEYGLSSRQIEDVVESKDSSVRLDVLAPRDGTIVQRHAVEGEPVEATTTLFEIADLASMWLHLKVHETDLAGVRQGQVVKFYPDGLPGQTFAGKVDWISPQLDPQTRTLQLRAEVANSGGVLKANMFGRADLVVEESRQRVVVPHTAVQSHQGQPVVFVQTGPGQFESRQVAIGAKLDGLWEVTSGLAAGERVATTGSFLLKSNLDNPEFGKVE